MSEANKARIRDLFAEVLSKGRHELVPEFYTEDCIAHDPANKADLRGHGELTALLDGYRAAFPDHQYELHQIVAEGDLVVARWTAHVAIAYKQVDIEGMSMCEMRDGRVRRIWQSFDSRTLLDELGEIGAPAEPGMGVPEAVGRAYGPD